MRQYQVEHSFCPKCKGAGHVTIYSFPFNLDDFDDVFYKIENYKDLNLCYCTECKDYHVVHDRIREGNSNEFG